LRHIYLGNVAEETNTTCPGCDRILLRRLGFNIIENAIKPGAKCPDCGEIVGGVGMSGKG